MVTSHRENFYQFIIKSQIKTKIEEGIDKSNSQEVED